MKRFIYTILGPKGLQCAEGWLRLLAITAITCIILAYLSIPVYEYFKGDNPEVIVRHVTPVLTHLAEGIIAVWVGIRIGKSQRFNSLPEAVQKRYLRIKEIEQSGASDYKKTEQR